MMRGDRTGYRLQGHGSLPSLLFQVLLICHLDLGVTDDISFLCATSGSSVLGICPSSLSTGSCQLCLWPWELDRPPHGPQGFLGIVSQRWVDSAKPRTLVNTPEDNSQSLSFSLSCPRISHMTAESPMKMEVSWRSAGGGGGGGLSLLFNLGKMVSYFFITMGRAAHSTFLTGL